MIFLKSQDCVFQVEILRHVSARWEFGEVGQVTPLPPPPTPHWSSVLQGYQAEIPAKKLKRGHRKKNFWPNFGWFYQKQAEKGPQKIFKRSSLFLAVITVINLIFNIQYTNFLRPAGLHFSHHTNAVLLWQAAGRDSVCWFDIDKMADQCC